VTGAGGKRFQVVQTFARADITYLKQDFSVFQPVANHGRLWPAEQRFDYLVRLRPLSKQERIVWQEKLKDFGAPPPQTGALLYALRELTGEDPGPTAADWQRLYSPVTGQRLEKALPAEERVAYLKDRLLEAPPRRQAELLTAFRDRAGPTYDRAVALAIPALTSDLQKLARSVLADRLYGLSRKELRGWLRDRAAELRRAAVRTCRLREEKALVPELIGLLDDGDAGVAREAHAALRQISGRDFGPARAADGDARRRAQAAWRAWWEQRQRVVGKPAAP
jgi:hypothetical protein